ncbi:hypothetical protein NT017_09790 [Prolixibacter sp. NT017]|nr:hypothetical protein NT017_09790 [Prolixibacter sp. NT017]
MDEARTFVDGFPNELDDTRTFVQGFSNGLDVARTFVYSLFMAKRIKAMD